MLGSRNRSLTMTLIIASALFSSTRAEAEPKTVSVDCAKGERISKALERGKQREVIVEIHGMCREHVVIRREGVTLRGSDPLVDGIQGPVGDPSILGLVEVWGAAFSPVIEGARFENLSISGSEGSGMFIADSTVGLVNCRVSGNARRGAHITANSFGRITGSFFFGNGDLGLRVQRNSQVVCDQCRFENNAGAGVSSWEGGVVNLTDCQIAGSTRGVWADRDGFIGGEDCVVTSPSWALSSTEQADVQWVGGSLGGSIEVSLKSLLQLRDATQGANPLGNRVERSSTVVFQGATLAGTTTLDTFSHGEARDGAALGVLECTNGSDLLCDGTETKNSSTCGACP